MSGVFGRSVFGDAVSQPHDPSRPTAVGSRVPSQGAWDLDHGASRTMTVSRVDPTRIPVAVAAAPAGSLVGAGQSKPLTGYRSAFQQVSQVHPRALPVGRMRDPRTGLMPAEEQRYWDQWIARFYPGVFHRPPMVGGNRYASYHSFGPPGLGGLIGFG